ncbi:MAG: hypothetical protein LBT29_04890, partial [Flavobacteriaceae bacterium]|nr:hypothetical protein [Flavobacteriaceae bacterium]
MNDIQARIQLLRQEINRLNYKYYVLDQSEVSDYEFDKMLEELKQWEKEYPQFDDPNS